MMIISREFTDFVFAVLEHHDITWHSDGNIEFLTLVDKHPALKTYYNGRNNSTMYARLDGMLQMLEQVQKIDLLSGSIEPRQGANESEAD